MQNSEHRTEALLLSLCLERQWATQTTKKESFHHAHQSRWRVLADRPRISPFSSFYNSQVNGACHQDPPGLVWEEHPADSSVKALTLFSCSLDSFYQWLMWGRQWGLNSREFFLPKAVGLSMHFPGRVTHLNVEGPLACLLWKGISQCWEGAGCVWGKRKKASVAVIYCW